MELNALAADGRLDLEQVAIRSEPLHERMYAIDAKLAASTRATCSAGLAGEDDAEDRWFSLPIDRQRDVARALIAEVRLLPQSRRGRPPKGAPRVDPSSVRITLSDLVTG